MNMVHTENFSRKVQKHFSNIQGLVSHRIICKIICLGGGLGAKKHRIPKSKIPGGQEYFHC